MIARQYKSKSRGAANTGSVLLGLGLGLAISGAFWAGHTFWPHPSDKSQEIVAAPAPAESISPKALANSGNNFIADIVAAASPCVVNIDTSTSVTVPAHGIPLGIEQFFFQGDDLQAPPRKYESHGAGSGVIIRADGYIITNNHVVQQADDIKVTLSDGRTFKGKVVGKDKYTDVALIKIPASGLAAAKLGSTQMIRPGDWAIAIGSPLGLSQSVTLGIVSALGRSLGDINAVDLIQTDAAINPGNSGGPLLNIKGEVIGINQAIRRDGQNISFAIPIDIAKNIAEQLMSSGSIKHAYLGISMVDMEPKIARLVGLPEDTKGVLIGKVEDGSPSQKSGLLTKDVLQRINGKAVGTSKEVQTLVRMHKPGEKLDMELLRQNEVVRIPVKIGDYEEVKSQESQTVPIP